MKKDELIKRLLDAVDDIEAIDQDDFDNGEIEDILVEARLPIARSNQPK